MSRAQTLARVVATFVLVATGAATAVAGQQASDAGPPPGPAATIVMPRQPITDLADPLAGVRIAEPDPVAEAAWDAADDPRVEYFGRPWVDTDRNGCPTDDDMQRRDLVDWSPRGRCASTGGYLPESYDGTRVERTRGALQLDHVVALHLIYITGGANLTQEQRVAAANDVENLIYTNSRSNQSKGDASLTEYLPDSATMRCRYVTNYVIVIKRYNLSMTAADVATGRRALAVCGS